MYVQRHGRCVPRPGYRDIAIDEEVYVRVQDAVKSGRISFPSVKSATEAALERLLLGG
jgi:hypothetical protein